MLSYSCNLVAQYKIINFSEPETGEKLLSRSGIAVRW